MSGKSLEPGRSTASRLLSLLDVFTVESEELALIEIAERAQLPVATAYRLVRELAQWGALERLSDRRYRVGLKLWEVGCLAPRQRDVREISRPYLHDLCEATKENVQIGVRDGDEVLIVDMVAARRAVPTATRVGGRLPLHATAVGKMTLAFSEPALLHRTLAKGLPKLAPRTLTMPGMLLSAVEQVRRTRLAFACEEMTRGASSVAAPILDERGELVASIALVVRASTDVARLGPAVRVAATALSREFHQPTPLRV